MPNEAAAPDLTILLAYGPLGIIAAFVFYFVLRYGTRLIEGHLSFMSVCEKSQAKIADALDTMSESHTSSGTSHAKTQKALKHIVRAGKEATECKDVHGHLDNALRELGD